MDDSPDNDKSCALQLCIKGDLGRKELEQWLSQKETDIMLIENQQKISQIEHNIPNWVYQINSWG